MLTKQILDGCIADLTMQIDAEYNSTAKPNLVLRQSLCAQRAAHIKVRDLVVKGDVLKARHFISAMCPDWSETMCKVIKTFDAAEQQEFRDAFAWELNIYVSESAAFTIARGV